MSFCLKHKHLSPILFNSIHLPVINPLHATTPSSAKRLRTRQILNTRKFTQQLYVLSPIPIPFQPNPRVTIHMSMLRP